MTTVDYGILAPAWAATGAAELVDDNALLTAILCANRLTLLNTGF